MCIVSITELDLNTLHVGTKNCEISEQDTTSHKDLQYFVPITVIDA
jgi:hypothetical protein